MPTISIFIRKDDLPKWQAIEHKSEWMHENLNSKATVLKVLDTRMKQGADDFANELRDKLGLKSAPTRYCKHGQEKGKCTQKDNKDCNK